MPLTALRRLRPARRRALTGAVAGLVAAGLLLWWLLPLEDTRPSGSVTFSTGARTGVYERYGNLLKAAMARDLPEVDVRLDGSEGSLDNVKRVATGKADFTIAAADAVAKYRIDQRAGADQLRGCARLYDDYMQLVVPRSSDVDSVADLRGKRVAVGGRASGVRLVADRILRAAGLDIDKDVDAVGIGIDTMPTALEAGQIDAFFWSGGLPTTHVRKLSEKVPIR
ncbi:TAXI family TRAP transporter solute-binding subunit, partial [Streptomyces sp. SID5785]